jgi:hypothetical protein
MEALHLEPSAARATTRGLLWIKKNIGVEYSDCLQKHFVDAGACTVAANISHTPLTSLLCEKTLDYMARDSAHLTREPVVTVPYARDAIEVIRQVPMDTHIDTVRTVVRGGMSQVLMECSDLDDCSDGGEGDGQMCTLHEACNILSRANVT